MSASKASKPAADFSARGPREIRSALAGKIDLEATQPQAEKQAPVALNAVLLPDEFLGRLGYRLSAKHARVFVIDGDANPNHLRERPLFPVWVARWDGEPDSPSVIVWVGFAYSDAVLWLRAQTAGQNNVGFIDRLRRGERAP